MKRKIISVLAAAAVLAVSTSVTAGVKAVPLTAESDSGSAGETQEASGKRPFRMFGGRMGGKGGFGFNFEAQTEEELAAQLAESVAEGKLTQEQADEIMSRHKEIQEGLGSLEKGLPNFREFGTKRGMLSEEELAAQLAEAVAEGKLTQEQADEMLARHKEMAENFNALKDGFTFEFDMPELGEGFTVQAQSAEELESKLAEAVAEGTITQEQSDEVIAKYKEMQESLGSLEERVPGNRGFGMKRGMLTEEELAAQLAEAVAEGKLTQEQADDMLARHKDMQASLDEFKDGFSFELTLPELGEGFAVQAQSAEELESKLAEAVAEGKLTQEQADKMLEMFSRKPQSGMFRNFGGSTQKNSGTSTPSSSGINLI